MNEQEFSLLTEQYLDGTLSHEGRALLGAEVQSNPDHRRLFEEQARQHIRIHAQTSKIDFTESQRIAIMVVDIAEKHRDPNAFMDILRRKTLRERFAAVMRGLKAPRESATYQNALDELIRIFAPVSVSMAINIALVLLIIFMVPLVLTPPKTEDYTVNLSTAPDPTATDPIEPAPRPPQPAVKPDQLIPDLLANIPPVPPRDQRMGDDTLPGMEQPPSSAESAPNGSTPMIAWHSPVISIPDLSGRDPMSRDKILKVTPGSELTEKAVINALRWLKGSQSTNGSWPGQETVAMTGLALLTYLAHGETPSSAEFGSTVEAGLKYLLARQDPEGFFSRNVYAHAIATYAMAEAFSLTRIVGLKAPAENAIKVIIDGQQANGSFDYNYRKGNRFDTSVTGWQIQALKAALIARIDQPGLDEALARSTRFLENEAFARDGSGFVYDGKPGIQAMKGGKTSMTGVGVLCLQMLGKPTSPRVLDGLRTLQDAQLDWPATGKAGVYSGYYVTQAKFHGPDKAEWNRWNRMMQQQLLRQQKADGHWEQGDHDNGSHVYTTALSTLMLEVYYRYLPTYAKRPESAPPSDRSSAEVSVDVR